jgi:hypothetical protein
MESKYLLLRNGRQSGPFTIGELLQQQLRPSDMIWIENKSTAWCYLSEMQLTPDIVEKVPAMNQNVPSMSNDEIERKAEELRKRALSYAPQHHYPGKDASSRPVKRQQPKEEEVFHFVDHRKDRKSVAQEVIMSFLIIAIFGASIYGSKSYFKNNQDIVPVAHKMVTTDQHTANANTAVDRLPEESSINSETSMAENQQAEPIPMTTLTDSASKQVEKPKTSSPKISRKKVVDTTLHTETPLVKEEVMLPPVVHEVPDTNSVKSAVTDENKDTTVQETKKKKGWGLFRKKKKDE